MVFGRRVSQNASAPSGGYPETLDVRSAEDVAWIKAAGDPLVWHDAALACLIFCGDPHHLLPWLASQPNLDRVTAAAMFLHNGNGAAFLTGAPLQCHAVDAETTLAMHERLRDLATSTILRDNGIGLPSGWDAARQATIVELGSSGSALQSILDRPIDSQTAEMPYCDVGEGELMSRSYLRVSMPFLLD